MGHHRYLCILPQNFCGSYVSLNLKNFHKWPCQSNSSETTRLIFYETSYMDGTSYIVVNVTMKFWSPHFFNPRTSSFVTLSGQLLWRFSSNFNETWFVERTSYLIVHITTKILSPHFGGSYVPLNFEKSHKWPCQLLWNYSSNFYQTSYVGGTPFDMKLDI